MDWTQVEERIFEDDRNKWDRTTLATGLKVTRDGALELSGGDKLPTRCALSELATGQMCSRLGIPVPYYRRLPDEMKAVVANHDLSRLGDSAYLLRGKDQWIRAFLSADYVAYNNGQIAETVKELLESAGVTVKSFVLEETHLYLKLLSDEIMDSASGLKAGVMIGNSEVGMGSVSVEPFVFRLPCTNDLIVSHERSFRHAHIRLRTSEMRRRMADAISEAFRVATSVLDLFAAAHDEQISDPVETIRQLAAARSLSQKFADEVASSYGAEPEPTRFGVINAFTRAAQKLAPLQRIDVERLAGGLLESKM